MSEIKLILIDSETVLAGLSHASVTDRCIAALCAEPETIQEFEAALTRYQRCPEPFCLSPKFHQKPASTPITDFEPFDAGTLIIDLAARVVVCDTDSRPCPEGMVYYDDDTQSTPLPIPYRVSDDWIFQYSLDGYASLRGSRIQERGPGLFLETRPTIYGRPLLEFIVAGIRQAAACGSLALGVPPVNLKSIHTGDDGIGKLLGGPSNDRDSLSDAITDIHSRWLLTPRDELRGQSPRTIMLAKQAFIDSDLESRAIQWSFQLEGPPCLPRESFAYRFAAFGSHEWVVYYYLVRHLIWTAVRLDLERLGSTRPATAAACVPDHRFGIGDLSAQLPAISGAAASESPFESLIATLDQIKIAWLTEPCADLDNRIPFIIIDNERKRLPEAIGKGTMVLDEDCPICRMLGVEATEGLEMCFWRLDACNMDDEFAFSDFRRIEDWEDERRSRELFSRGRGVVLKSLENSTSARKEHSEQPWFGLDDLFEVDLPEAKQIAFTDNSNELDKFEGSWFNSEPDLPEA